MYFYVDDSGQTGLELFDKNQPFLYYGVLSSKVNLDELALPSVQKLRKRLGVERLHAAELGNGRLVEIVDDLEVLRKKFDIKFDFYRIAKADHAIISFFDQVFDQGVNPAVPWTAYWTPLRYVLLLKLASLFNEDMAKEAWKARTTIKNSTAEAFLINVCESVLARVNSLPDARSIEIITDALNWVIKNPEKIHYNAHSKKDRLQISPNLIGFQSVMHGIAKRLEKSKSKSRKVVVDRQSQFNKAQEWIAELYQNTRHLEEPMAFGPGLPTMDLRHMPTVPIECTPGTESAGLELVDVYIWVFKRHLENKELAPPLFKIIKKQLHKGMYDEVSLNVIGKRWGQWFDEIPELSDEDLNNGRELLAMDEKRRQQFIE
ncbi:TPA: DUF3800 domain-containing protein [Vibrio parahaemolyticus]|uniref:DUF3800 domain-containing protein n=1 Tax=Vibrio parahaemolyticus TaxID=670 RepID=UPI00079FD637|nr:DUF3800 domain-containing protein [Vibrio parahaemolyticus]EGQ9353923.1 DUF3800 domain-containing protein [Vibrio parahaemolyticus]EGQ9517569.1 DUF3800 domain-containing protein [Vibrio parahaemolyticus]EIM7933103.1 DUF3800 domain-containing protein [Vibrio parahaemolyticus]EJQ8021081.1 DUF3800 domain-containing protein [Vibrio parahaemolyticus]EJU8978905.1 DUF3800 domain-containing protein [Vibrio parahaemolyticus]